MLAFLHDSYVLELVIGNCSSVPLSHDTQVTGAKCIFLSLVHDEKGKLRELLNEIRKKSSCVV